MDLCRSLLVYYNVSGYVELSDRNILRRDLLNDCW